MTQTQAYPDWRTSLAAAETAEAEKREIDRLAALAPALRQQRDAEQRQAQRQAQREAALQEARTALEAWAQAQQRAIAALMTGATTEGGAFAACRAVVLAFGEASRHERTAVERLMTVNVCDYEDEVERRTNAAGPVSSGEARAYAAEYGEGRVRSLLRQMAGPRASYLAGLPADRGALRRLAGFLLDEALTGGPRPLLPRQEESQGS